MIKGIYALYDTKSEFFAQPFFGENKATAMRSLAQFVNEPNGQSTPQKYPNDFILYELGTYDDKTGKFTNHETPQILGHASDFKEKP